MGGRPRTLLNGACPCVCLCCCGQKTTDSGGRFGRIRGTLGPETRGGGGVVLEGTGEGFQGDAALPQAQRKQPDPRSKQPTDTRQKRNKLPNSGTQCTGRSATAGGYRPTGVGCPSTAAPCPASAGSAAPHRRITATLATINLPLPFSQLKDSPADTVLPTHSLLHAALPLSSLA